MAREKLVFVLAVMAFAVSCFLPHLKSIISGLMDDGSGEKTRTKTNTNSSYDDSVMESALETANETALNTANEITKTTHKNLRFCGSKKMVFPLASFKESKRRSLSRRLQIIGENVEIPIKYQCRGQAYDTYANRLGPYAEQVSSMRRYWGKRDFPFPAHTDILAIGNSHTRQTIFTLLCQYSDQVKSVRLLGPRDIPDFAILLQVFFYNNATLILSCNHPFTFSSKWHDLFQSYDPLHRTIDQFDIFVLGMQNNYSPKDKAAMIPLTLNYEEKHPEMLMDYRHITGPSLETVASIILNSKTNNTKNSIPPPIIALPKFSKSYGLNWEADANRTAEKWNHNHTSPNNSNKNPITVMHTRQHIEALGTECGTNNVGLKNGPDICHHTEEDRGSVMHRCTGPKGGDADLIAWDLIEAIHKSIDA